MQATFCVASIRAKQRLRALANLPSCGSCLWFLRNVLRGCTWVPTIPDYCATVLYLLNLILLFRSILLFFTTLSRRIFCFWEHEFWMEHQVKYVKYDSTMLNYLWTVDRFLYVSGDFSKWLAQVLGLRPYQWENTHTDDGSLDFYS